MRVSSFIIHPSDHYSHLAYPSAILNNITSLNNTLRPFSIYKFMNSPKDKEVHKLLNGLNYSYSLQEYYFQLDNMESLVSYSEEIFDEKAMEYEYSEVRF